MWTNLWWSYGMGGRPVQEPNEGYYQLWGGEAGGWWSISVEKTRARASLEKILSLNQVCSSRWVIW